MEIIKVSYAGQGQASQDYSQRDDTLIINNFINTTFGESTDVIEYFITDENGIRLSHVYDSKNYYVDSQVSNSEDKFSQIRLDPESDVKGAGFTRGTTNIQYSFFKNLFNSNFQNRYFIKEISNSRLELKLSSQTISGEQMSQGLQSYQIYASQKNYYTDFYLNFANNDLIIGVNAAYVNENGVSFLLIKLYEPLPLDFDVKSTLWIVDKLSDSVAYNVNILVEAEQVIDQNKLRGANFKISVTDAIGQTTPYYSYNSLFSSPISSSIQQLSSYYEDKAISINVDYTNFDNFIHFSSATERINNFAYKITLIENYNKQIYSQSVITGNNQIVSSSIQTIKNNIDNIINKFDPYEYYLYYASESFSWPKSTSVKPYLLYSVTSSQVTNWLGSENTVPSTGITSILYSASLYDSTNKDILKYTAIPQYIVDDPSNAPYTTFVDMVAQHFDNIWIYYKDLSNRYNATNDPDTGISLDLVSEALKGFGIQLYTNTNLSDNVFYSLFGYNQDGSLLPPTGSEKRISYVTSSLSTLPYDQTVKEVYKRLYHNLPYLLKTKGTERGIKALIACYGIPDTILFPMEFGGYDRTERSGLIDWNPNKVNVISSSLQLSQSVLSPYTTIQYFDNDNRKNSTDIEVGFSPSNTINSNISSSIGYFNIDQLIGNPKDQYSSSYSSLDAYRQAYFTGSYTYQHSVSEYIRLLKFYNNSLFKIIKDFVPARSNVSTGIIVKPHILERSKYLRHEPSMSFQNYSESIDTAFITASAANSYTINSTNYYLITSSIGYIPVTKSFGFENYTGEYGGTELEISSLDSLGNQTEESKNAITASYINLGALYQNITGSVRSQRYLDLDFGSNVNVPVNFDIIKKTISSSQVDNYSTYTNTSNPYAELQDYNYFAQRSTIPRYYGSKAESLKYNVFSTASSDWKGDASYGNSPAIDLRTLKIGLFTQIATSSFFPGQVNATLAYLVDGATGLFELNQLNNNWFELQNTFKAGKTLTIKQFDNKKYSNQKFTDGVKFIYESGYSYAPILYFSSGSDNKVYFEPIETPDAYLRANNQYNNTYQNTITGSLGLVYPNISAATGYSGSIYNIFDNIDIDNEGLFTVGNSSSLTYPTYSVAYAGNYSINASFTMYLTASQITDSASFTLNIKKNGTLITSSYKQFIYGTQDNSQNFFYVYLGVGA